MANQQLIDPTQDLWEQMPDEGQAPYDYFIRYRDMGTGRQRNLLALAQSMGLSVATMQQYSSVFNWKERVRAWDQHQQEKRSAELEQRRDMVRKLTWDDTLRFRREMVNRVLDTIPAIEQLVTPGAIEVVREQGGDTATVIVKVEVDANYWRQIQEAIALSNRELRIAAEMPTNYSSSKVAVDHQSSTFESFLEQQMQAMLNNG